MSINDRLESVVGSTAYDQSGEKIGKVSTLYLDNQSSEPKWVSVNTGLFGLKDSLVPLQGAQLDGDKLVVVPSKEQIKDAPHLDAEEGISSQEESELYRHYGLGSGTSNAAGTANTSGTDANDSGRAAAGTAAAGTAAASGRSDADTRAGTSSDDNGDIIRHEERLNVGKTTEATGKATLRKYVVTETQQVEVPVQREELRVEREPISKEDAAKYAGGTIGEQEHEVILHEERVTVDKEAVPVERVRASVDTVTENQTISDEVRKEVVETGEEGKGGKR